MTNLNMKHSCLYSCVMHMSKNEISLCDGIFILRHTFFLKQKYLLWKMAMSRGKVFAAIGKRIQDERDSREKVNKWIQQLPLQSSGKLGYLISYQYSTYLLILVTGFFTTQEILEKNL